MPFKDGKYFQNIPLESVHNAVSPVNQLSYVGIADFRHYPSASRVICQYSLSIVNQGINKPNSALQAVTCNEILDLSQIFTGFS